MKNSKKKKVEPKNQHKMALFETNVQNLKEGLR